MIAALRPQEKRYSVSDSHGLSIRVHPSGTKSWCLRVSSNGKVTDITLGHFPEISLKHARQLARRKRKELGQEPPDGYTFNDAFRLWCNLKKGRIVSYRDERRLLERHLIPHIKNRQLDTISAPLIIHVVKPLEREGKQVTLKRVIMRCREILDLAVCAGFIQHNPIERLSRIFPAPIATPMPAIDWRDLPAAFCAVKNAPVRMKILFLWSLCSMLRPGETAKLEWSWIGEDNVLCIPAEKMKKNRPHRVPLNQKMMLLLDCAKETSAHPHSKFIFPSRTGDKPMSSQTMAKFLHSTSLTGKLVAHGLRSVARSWMADNLMPYEAAEACLSHLTGSSVSRAYQRSDFLDVRKDIYERWCDFVFSCADGAGFLDDFPSARTKLMK